MKQKGISAVVTLALVAIGFGMLPAPCALAGGATTAYDYVPAYIPDDSTPFVVRVTFSNLVAGDCYIYKVRLFRTTSSYNGESWNAVSGNWVPTGAAYNSQNQFTATAASQSFWISAKNTSLAASTTSEDARLAVVAASNGTTCASAPSFANGTPANVTVIKMTSGGTAVQFGGWLEETNGTARAGRAYVVKSGATIVGMYVSEDNGVNEGYPATVMAAAAPAAAGYSKVAVPACTDCNYTIESWSLAAPGTTDGLINTMGSGTCPNAVAAGGTTSLDTCTSPTVVSLRSLRAARGSTLLAAPSLAAPSLAGLALLGGLAVVMRRRRA